ncbi:MAG: RNA polymerase sigma factor [Deltaproteobacteria bacterium]|nr:MAG: RNA polymerase sigma factor [Deltaproteobacteria bacterium]
MSVNITVSGRRRAARTGKRPASHSMPATGSIEASIVHLLPRYQHPSGVKREMAVRDGRPGFHAPPGRRVTEASMSRVTQASMSPRPVSLAELTERHRGEIVGYLARLLGDHQEAEDACQEAFMRAHRAFGRLAPDANSRAWLYRIATNTGLNAARRRSHRAARRADVHPDALPADAGPSLERREELRAVRRAVEALPPRQRAALMLRQFQDLGYAEIAATLGGNEDAARANVYQALKKLRAALGRGVR